MIEYKKYAAEIIESGERIDGEVDLCLIVSKKYGVELTLKQATKLLKLIDSTPKAYDGTKCPNCGSEDINGYEFEVSDCNSAYRNCDCFDCGASWTEDFKIVGFSELTVPEKP